MMTQTIRPRGTTTDLHRAAMSGDIAIVRDAIASGQSLDVRDPDGYTPLLLAGKHAEPEVFHALIDAGADIEATDARGMSALFVVATTGIVSLARRLLAKGADVNRVAARGLTPLVAGIMGGNPSLVRLLIARGANVKHRDAAGTSILRWARQLGTTEIVELIRQPDRASDTVIDMPDPIDLHRAARTGDVECIHECLSSGVSIEALDDEGFTALLLACRHHRRAAIAALLAAGAKPHRGTRTGVTPLMLAATNAIALRPFVAAGVDLNRASKRLGITALHHAARHGVLESSRFLLASGADPLRSDRKGRTPLDHAEAHGHRRIVQLLAGASHDL